MTNHTISTHRLELFIRNVLITSLGIDHGQMSTSGFPTTSASSLESCLLRANSIKRVSMLTDPHAITKKLLITVIIPIIKTNTLFLERHCATVSANQSSESEDCASGLAVFLERLEPVRVKGTEL